MFPNYDPRFRWEGKIGATLLFTSLRVDQPRTMCPRVETLSDEHSDMVHFPPELPSYPYLIKANQGGEGSHVWLIDSEDALAVCLQKFRQLELQR